MGKICTFCKYNESKDKCGLIESMASVKYTERCTYYEPVKNVAPVIHAYNKSKDGFLCSACTFGDFGLFRDYTPTYCPNCGAKMDEEVQDNGEMGKS